MSNILNLIDPMMVNVVTSVLDKNEVNQLKGDKSESECGMNTECKDMYDALLSNNSDSSSLLAAILYQKRLLVLEQKRPTELYSMLSIMETLVDNFDNWSNKSGATSEMTAYRSCASILEKLFKFTSIQLKDGENISLATKYATELHDVVFPGSQLSHPTGRRIDLLLCGHSSELCTNEWKKANVSPSILHR
ncbi:hypothetical protein DM01DRAFT_1135250 [Hesseltinella vesiculosa]|uniref:Uncharacterized protein n=1 Tax=Hesseltinella vesiculosa TaxID=101127 RepID=A0A1X2G929_9FUNG|nr:hypothetical protein DM01DRAFT_1135250 [Hesseltinella vesiculosa]